SAAGDGEEPGAPGVDAGARPAAGLDDGRSGIDVGQVGQEAREVEVEVGEEVDLVDDDDVGGPEHHRVLERLLLALGDGVDHGPGVFADGELRRADEVADVLDQQQVEVGQRQAVQPGPDHGGVEV